MASLFSTNQFQDLLSFPFHDPQWKKKLFIGSLLSLAIYTIILAPVQIFLVGYYYRIMKHIIVDGGEPYLPEWDDWGKLFTDGLKLLIPGFFFGLPGMLLIFLSIGGSFLSVVALGNSEINNNFLQPLEPLLPIFPLIGMILFLLCFGSGMILAFVLGFLQAPAICHVVATDQISGAFRIMEWINILKRNFIGFLLANLTMYCISMVLSLILQLLSMTIVLLIFFPILLAFVGLYSALIYYALLAGAYVTGKTSRTPQRLFQISE